MYLIFIINDVFTLIFNEDYMTKIININIIYNANNINKFYLYTEYI